VKTSPNHGTVEETQSSGIIFSVSVIMKYRRDRLAFTPSGVTGVASVGSRRLEEGRVGPRRDNFL
jgi:hypothetical protein